MSLLVLEAGPAIAVQDLGREGYIAKGLTRGGAADRLAIAEGAALLGQDKTCAALEMVGLGGKFEAKNPCLIALTGAAMRTKIDGAPVVWNAAHTLKKGALLEIGPSTEGTYGYLHIAGGIETPKVLGARGTHLSVGIGALLKAGDTLSAGQARAIGSGGSVLPRDDRFGGGLVRVVVSAQTSLFDRAIRARFQNTAFTRDPRADRQGMRLGFEGEGFLPQSGLSIVSEIIAPGDIQITGDGTPFILLAESQTTGGYPRIGTVLPCDLPRAVQCPIGKALRFVFVSVEEARSIEARARRDVGALKPMPLVRNPKDMGDLLSYNLISGAIAGSEE